MPLNIPTPYPNPQKSAVSTCVRRLSASKCWTLPADTPAILSRKIHPQHSQGRNHPYTQPQPPHLPHQPFSISVSTHCLPHTHETQICKRSFALQLRVRATVVRHAPQGHHGLPVQNENRTVRLQIFRHDRCMRRVSGFSCLRGLCLWWCL